MKICIIGHTGFVGKAVYNYFNKPPYQITGINSNTYYLPTCKFNIIINCAGNSKKYIAIENPNIDFHKTVGLFSRILKLKADKFIQISSIDADSLNNYGKSKIISELCSKLYFEKTTILRLGGLVGNGLKKNVIYDILNNKNLFVTLNSVFNYISTS